MDKEKIIGCPGCLLRLPDRNLNPDVRFNASGECRQLYYEITYYTLSKNDPGFIHQLVVDAYAGPAYRGKDKDYYQHICPLSVFTLQQKKDIPADRCSRHI